MALSGMSRIRPAAGFTAAFETSTSMVPYASIVTSTSFFKSALLPTFAAQPTALMPADLSW
jgi:hypothetical protein